MSTTRRMYANPRQERHSTGITFRQQKRRRMQRLRAAKVGTHSAMTRRMTDRPSRHVRKLIRVMYVFVAGVATPLSH